MIIDKSLVKKILLIKPRGIGDVVLSTIVFDNLVKSFPDSKIDYLTESPSKPFLEPLNMINEVLIFENEKKFNIISVINKVKSRKYDLVIDFFSNPRTALVTFFSRVKYRVGFPYRGRKYAYNLYGPVIRNKYHAAELHLALLKELGIESSSKEMHFGLLQSDKDFVNKFFSENFSKDDFVIGISPSGGWQSKKCDPVKFAEIGKALIQKYSSKILIVWGPKDKDDALQIEKLINYKVTLAPATDIRKMGALISKCNILIANDSGPMHISVALKTPTLSLHGPTLPQFQGPFGEMHEWIRLEELDCIGCNLLTCPRKHECFLNLPVEKILLKVESLIKKNSIPVKVK
jgi:heptosyltransferase III